MTILNIVALALLIVVGCGGHRFYLLLRQGFTCIASPATAKRLAFVGTVVIAVAIGYPFLVPQDTVLELLVWFAYLGFAALGAWHIYDVLTNFKISFRIRFDS